MSIGVLYIGVGCYWWDKGNFILFRKGTRREGGRRW
jgi:hypothetical protein